MPVQVFFGVQVVCGRIEMQAAWCMIGLICPGEGEQKVYQLTVCLRHQALPHKEGKARHLNSACHAVADVECCAGRSKAGYISPGKVPKKCQAAVDRVDACIKQHQQQQDPG